MIMKKSVQFVCEYYSNKRAGIHNLIDLKSSKLMLFYYLFLLKLLYFNLYKHFVNEFASITAQNVRTQY